MKKILFLILIVIVACNTQNPPPSTPNPPLSTLPPTFKPPTPTPTPEIVLKSVSVKMGEIITLQNKKTGAAVEFRLRPYSPTTNCHILDVVQNVYDTGNPTTSFGIPICQYGGEEYELAYYPSWESYWQGDTVVTIGIHISIAKDTKSINIQYTDDWTIVSILQSAP